MARLKVMQFGLGPIGVRAARLVAAKDSLRLVAAIDVDPAKVGKDVGDLDAGRPVGMQITSDAPKALDRTQPDVVLHTTSSSFAAVYPQLEMIVSAGVSVVSSTEELLFPALKNPELAARLDKLAREKKAVVLGTGVNPGFVMDTLPLILTSVCYDVKKVTVERRVDASTRRLPLQKKVGAGMTVEQFEELKAKKGIGHVGLPESMALIAHGLGWPIEKLEEDLHPMIAPKDIKTEFLEVKKGQVAGIHNTGKIVSGGAERIALDLKMFVGAENPGDRVVLESTPAIDCRLSGGVAGDLATAAMLVNLAPRVVDLARINPGLHLMTEVGLPRLVG